MNRREDHCAECHEVREMATKTLCFTCYRRIQRARERVDHQNPAIRREHKKLLRGYASLLGSLGELGIGTSDVSLILAIVSLYVEPIRQFLNVPPPTIDSAEHEPRGSTKEVEYIDVAKPREEVESEFPM